MSKQINVISINEISNSQSKNEVFLNTENDVKIHVSCNENSTFIKLPYGNEFEIINRCIIIKPINKSFYCKDFTEDEFMSNDEKCTSQCDKCKIKDKL